MSSLPGIIGLLVSIYVRPHEFFEPLRHANANYVFFALCLLGTVGDLVARRARLAPTPLLPYVLAFGIWCAVTVALRGLGLLANVANGIVVDTIIFLVLAHGIHRARALYVVALSLLACGLFVTYVGVDQGVSPLQCVVFDPVERIGVAYSDGRPCALVDADGIPLASQVDCMEGGIAGLPYQCERVGLFGTTSIGGGRVRYVGVLLDPNDLALAASMALPFAFAVFEVRRSRLSLALVIASVAGIGVLVVLTQSRGGMLAFGAVLGAYFLKKFGWRRGAVAFGAMAVPVLLLGGRSSASASESTLERLGCACAGIKMLIHSPLVGVGYRQFVEHHNLTAHNAYILVAAELGAPGLWLFAVIVWLSLKIPLTILRFDVEAGEASRTVKALAMAMLSALAGACAGIFFLSWSYHCILWIYFGLSAALYTVWKRVAPAYQCRLTFREAWRIALGCAVALAAWAQYIRMKGAWE